MTLPNLINSPDSTDMTELKSWREIRSNSRDNLLARNENRALDVDTTAGGTIVLTISQREEYVYLRLTGTPGAGYTVEFADGNKQMVIENLSGQTAIIETATGATVPATIISGDVKEVQIRGTDITTSASVSLETGALLHSGGVDPTGPHDWLDHDIKSAVLYDIAYAVTSPSSSGKVLTLDCENGNWFDVTLTEDVDLLDILNPATHFSGILLEDGSGKLLLEGSAGTLLQEDNDAIANVFLITTQDGSGGWAITFPSAFKWEQQTGGSPGVSTGAGEIDVWWFFKIATNSLNRMRLESGATDLLLLENGDYLLHEDSGDDVWLGNQIGKNMGE